MITLKLNAKAVELAEEGKTIYNLTAGQLPFRPMNEFVELIRSESDFLKSFQYSPVAGYPELKKKILENFQETRGVDLASSGVEFDCVVSNGGKHCLSNIFGSLIDHGDEMILQHQVLLFQMKKLKEKFLKRRRPLSLIAQIILQEHITLKSG